MNEPIPVPDNDHEDVINTDREETYKEAITGVDEQNIENTHDNTLSTQDIQT